MTKAYKIIIFSGICILMLIFCFWAVNFFGEKTSDTNFSKYSGLLALKTNIYEEMTVQEFRENALTVLFEKGNEEKNQKLLSEALADENIQLDRFTNDSAFFIRNILIPLVSEEWKSDYISGAVEYPFSDKIGEIEFKAKVKIKNTETSIGEYENILKSLINTVKEVLHSKTKTQLEDDTLILKELNSKLSDFSARISSENNVSLKIENCFYIIYLIESKKDMPLENSLKNGDETKTETTFLETDIQKLLSLKTDNYEKYTLKDFKEYITGKLTTDSELKIAKERVMKSISSAPKELSERLSLPEIEFDFIAYTLSCSIAEISYDVTKQAVPSFEDGFWIKSSSVGDTIYLEYIVNYVVKDPNVFTVVQRDRAILNVVNGMEEFVKQTTLDPVNEDYLKSMKKALDKLIKDNSTKDFKMEVLSCTN